MDIVMIRRGVGRRYRHAPVAGMHLAELELPTRVYNSLHNFGVRTVDQLQSFTAEDLLSLREFGEWSLRQVYVALARLGMGLREG